MCAFPATLRQGGIDVASTRPLDPHAPGDVASTRLRLPSPAPAGRPAVAAQAAACLLALGQLGRDGARAAVVRGRGATGGPDRGVRPDVEDRPGAERCVPFTRLRADGVWALDRDVPMDNVGPLREGVTGRLEAHLRQSSRRARTCWTGRHAGSWRAISRRPWARTSWSRSVWTRNVLARARAGGAKSRRGAGAAAPGRRGHRGVGPAVRLLRIRRRGRWGIGRDRGRARPLVQPRRPRRPRQRPGAVLAGPQAVRPRRARAGRGPCGGVSQRFSARTPDRSSRLRPPRAATPPDGGTPLSRQAKHVVWHREQVFQGLALVG